MGIQINKVKPELLKNLAQQYMEEGITSGAIPQGWKWSFPECDARSTAIVAYFCHSCGNELYGRWTAPYVLEFDEVAHSNPHGTDLHGRTYFSNSSDVIRNAKDEYKKSIEKEISWMQSLTHCLICGELLSHDMGYYIEGETGHVIIKERTVTARKQKYDMFEFKRLNEVSQISEYEKIQDPASSNVINKIFNEMNEIRLPEERAVAQRETEHFCELCDLPAQMPSNQENIDKIKSNTVALKDYILHLVKLESSMHSVRERLNALYLKRISVERKKIAERFIPAMELKRRIEEAELEYQTAFVQREKLEKAAPEPIELEIPNKPTPPVLETPGLFNKKSVLAKNEALQMQYQADLAEYTLLQQNYLAEKARLEQEARDKLEHQRTKAEARISATKKELERLKSEYEEYIGSSAEKSTPASQVKALFDKEICDAEDLLRNLYKCRNELYSYGVVYEKYHNVVAVSTFYEYLMAGRCEALEGVNGAYNLYESELRADLIIGRLDQITETLEQIRDNQYTLYSEMKKTNTHLSNLQYTMDEVVSGIDGMKAELKDISENTKVIAYNTEATAYYTKMTAELTNAMGYMVAFK